MPAAHQPQPKECHAVTLMPPQQPELITEIETPSADDRVERVIATVLREYGGNLAAYVEALRRRNPPTDRTNENSLRRGFAAERRYRGQ